MSVLHRSFRGVGSGVFKSAAAAGAALAASATSFLISAADGATIATIRNPFSGATTFVTIGAVPAQLTVSAAGVIARTNTAAVAGTTYSVKVRATSADGKREMAETFNFLCVALVIPSVTGVIPDIVEGDTGTVDLEIIGVAPLALSDVDKPSWMTLEIVGNALRATWTNASLGG